MTRYFFISFFFLGLLAAGYNIAYAKVYGNSKMNISVDDEPGSTDMTNPATSQAATPKNTTKALPGEENSDKKDHPTKSDELPGIHHFHKERISKVKRHHKKFWILSKLLLILCHLALLILAYVHTVE